MAAAKEKNEVNSVKFGIANGIGFFIGTMIASGLFFREFKWEALVTGIIGAGLCFIYPKVFERVRNCKDKNKVH